MSDITKATGRPKHMETVAQEFIQKFMKSGFVAVHWRYNDDDWWHGGCDIDSGIFKNGANKDGANAIFCKKLSLMRKPEIFAQQVNIYLSQKFNAQEKEKRTIPQNIKVFKTPVVNSLTIFAFARGFVKIVAFASLWPWDSGDCRFRSAKISTLIFAFALSEFIRKVCKFSLYSLSLYLKNR